MTADVVVTPTARRYLAADAFFEMYINDDDRVFNGDRDGMFTAMRASEHADLRPFLAWEFSLSAADIVLALDALPLCHNVLAVVLALACDVPVVAIGMTPATYCLLQTLAVRYNCPGLFELGMQLAAETQYTFNLSDAIEAAINGNSPQLADVLMARMPSPWTIPISKIAPSVTMDTYVFLTMHPRTLPATLRAIIISDTAVPQTRRIICLAALYNRGANLRFQIAEEAIAAFTRVIVECTSKHAALMASAIRGLAAASHGWHVTAGRLMLNMIAVNTDAFETDAAVTVLGAFQAEGIRFEPTDKVVTETPETITVTTTNAAGTKSMTNILRWQPRKITPLNVALERWCVRYRDTYPCPLISLLLELGSVWTAYDRTLAAGVGYTIRGDDEPPGKKQRKMPA